MPKIATYPTLYDEVLQISITKLKEWNYLEPNNYKSGVISWSRNGIKHSSISIAVNTLNENTEIELSYNWNDEPRKYKIQLVSMPSNLGKGLIWFFLCPHTNKRCRKIFSIGGYFLHREAFKGCYYETQTQSKYYRNLDKTLGAYFRTDRLYEQLYKKHFKKMYAGKPTKKYLRIMEQIQKAESIPYSEIERLMIK